MKTLFTCILLGGLLGFGQPASLAAAEPAAQEIDHIVAVVNDDVISRSELDTRLYRIKQQLKQKGARLPSDEILARQLLDQMILERLQLQVAKRAGIRVDDETVNRVIANLARENRLSLDKFRQVLAREGYDFADFRENIRNEIILTQLRKRQIENRITVTEREIDNFLANQAGRKGSDDEFHLAHILIAVPEAASPEQIETARRKAEKVLNQLRDGADFTQLAIAVSNGQYALQGGDLGWRKAGQLPTLFSDVVLNMQPGQISTLIRSPSGFHIIKLLERRSPEQRHVVQQTLARHILIRPNEVQSSEEARQRLVRLRKRILAGEDFGQLARANSDDTGSAVDGGSLGWVNPGTMVPRFEEEMNKLKAGEISEPFQTRYGWHIVQVMARRNHDDTRQFKRLQARRLIGKRKTDEAMANWLRQLRSEAYVEIRLNQ